MRKSYVAVVGIVAVVATSACGGLVEPEWGWSPDARSSREDGAPDAAPRADAARDATIQDALVDADALPFCSADGALETTTCLPPADDHLFPAEASITAPAGAFATATFIGTGPWILDREFYVQYLSSSFGVVQVFSLPGIGSPQTVVFEPLASSAGTHGTLTVQGTAGAVLRTATVAVDIIECVPKTKAFVCSSAECGDEPDFCGGTVTCGTCEGASPYCWQYQCIPFKPHGCGDFEAFDPATGGCQTCPCGVMDNACEDCFH